MKLNVLLVILGIPFWISAQQVSDSNYNPVIHYPAYESSKGSVLYIDEGHHNFHTKDGRYRSFARLMERDGYRVLAYSGEFTKQELSKGKILVISNALNEINVGNWYLPTPSAFTVEEMEAAKEWVYNGGSLFLIADHMPMAGAATDLAKVFGFEFTNGFVMNTQSRVPDFFTIEDKSLSRNIITNGRNTEEQVSKIASFTGQAFKIPQEATSILTFGKNYVNMLPDTAWVFNEGTSRHDPEGWSQGAFRKFGKGKVVVFGEAALFSAQLSGPNQVKMGMNHAMAPENYQLLLNIIHWLDGLLD